MNIDLNVVFVILIMFSATFLRSALGFGDGIIGMPFLAMTVGIINGSPLMALISLSVGLVILLRHWRNVEFASTWRLILSAMVGIPIGIYFLKGVNDVVVKTVLAIFIILFSVFKLINPKFKKLQGEGLAYPAGFFAGILGGAYNTSGPPIIFYATLKQWTPVNFRATLQGYFFITGLFVVLGHALAGNYTPTVLKYYVLSLPFVLLAIYTGGKLHFKIPAENFITIIYWMLILVGLMLLATSYKLV